MKHLRLLVVSILVGFTSFSAVAQAPAPVAAAAPVVSTNKITKHCLWQAKGKHNTVLLMGSLHAMKDSMYPLARELEAAYQQAAVVVFETDMAALESPALAMKMMAAATYAEGDSLQKNLTPATYALLVSNLQSSPLSVEMLNQFKPWMAALTLVMTELQQEGFNMQNGLDKHFFTQAQADKKVVEFFESPEFQIGLLTSLGDRESEEFLNQTLRDLAVMKKEFEQLVKTWSAGDAKGLDKLLLDSFREYPLLYKKFLLDRNHTWIPKLEQLLQGDKDVLVVVGAGHLVGKESVVDLLKAKGYQIEQR